MVNIEVISVDEETGKVELELDEEARAWLIEVGFNKVLRDAIETEKSILDMVHESAKDLHEAGVMKETTLREFDALCRPPEIQQDCWMEEKRTRFRHLETTLEG